MGVVRAGARLCGDGPGRWWGLEPRLVAVRHDPAVVRGGDRVRVELLHDLLQEGKDLVLDCLGAEDVVRGHTDLAAVVELPPAESLHGVLQVARPVNVGRGLPAQLQGAGGQVLVSCCPGVVQFQSARRGRGGSYPLYPLL